MPSVEVRFRRSVCIGVGAVLGAAGMAAGQDVTMLGDIITASSANHPVGEAPQFVIDNRGDTKYLNFDEINTGFTVTPSGTGIVRGIVIMTAGDAPERDPTSFTLEGSDDGINFVPIASGTLSPSTIRRALAHASFDNSTSYLSYRVLFPTVRSQASANSMQVAEVQLVTWTDILSPGDPFTVTYTGGASSPVGEGPANLFDDRLGTKLGVFDGNLGPTFIDVTPGVGATVITGVNVLGAADDAGFQGRTPSYIIISGSNDGVNYTPIFNNSLYQFAFNFEDQQYSFANAVSYTSYRLELGPCLGDTFLQLGDLQLHGEVSMTPPANDECIAATVVGIGTSAGTNFNATVIDPSPCGANDAADVWFSFTSPVTGMVEANTFGPSDLDTTLAVYSGCGGTLIDCNDNARRGQSRVRWSAQSGSTYLLRVAGVDGAMGNFSLTLDDSPDIREEVHLALNYNFNGMVHAGEDNDPDNVDGFRGISDRALRQTGAPGSIEVGLEGSSGIGYSVPDQAGVLDIVHLGNRNLVDTFNWAFDLVADGDDVGVQPAWLADPDQTAPQISDVSSLGLEMTAETRIGVLFNASNGGSNFEMALGFAGGSVVTISLSAPDWFGDQVPTPPAFGVESQLQFGLYSGSGLVDSGVPSVDLNVVEAIVSVQDLINDGFGDITGLVLESVTFQNSFNPNAGTAIYAVTVQDALSEPSCIADFDGNGTVAVPDIFAFLSAWFAGSGSADINGDMDVTVPDIFAFLSLWFAGCP